MSDDETIDIPDPTTTRRHVLEFVGQARVIIGQRGRSTVQLAEASATLSPGDVLVLRPARESGYPIRAGFAVVQDVVTPDTFRTTGHLISTISNACGGDYVYRVGRALTPSLEERIAALERFAVETELGEIRRRA